MDSIKFCNEATALIDTWLNLPKPSGVLCPYKASFSPTKLGKYLRSVFLLEYVSDNEVFVRVAGTNLREYLGREVTGKNLLAIYPEPFREPFQQFYKNLQSTPCAGYSERPYKNTSNTVSLFRSIHLPLLNTDGKTAFFVGIIKSIALPESSAHLKTKSWNSETDLKLRYIEIGAGTPTG